MDVSPCLTSDIQPPVGTQPRQRPLDHLAAAAQPPARVDALAVDAHLGPALRQRHSAPRDVIRLVGMQLLRPASREPASVSFPINWPSQK